MTRQLIVAALALLFAFCTPMTPAIAEPETPTSVLLARAYVGEAGWHSRRDHAAIFHAVANRSAARGVAFRTQLLAYAKGINGRSWVADLRGDGTLGEAWPEQHYPRERFEPLWRRVLVFAATDVVFEPENPCDGNPEHWGGMAITTDRLRAHRAVEDGRWAALDCGGTRNRFYAVRGRRSRPELLAVGPVPVLW